MEHRTNLGMAIEAFEDEMSGIESYSRMLEDVTCPELAKIIKDNVNAEKKHASYLLGWINAASQKALR